MLLHQNTSSVSSQPFWIPMYLMFSEHLCLTCASRSFDSSVEAASKGRSYRCTDYSYLPSDSGHKNTTALPSYPASSTGSSILPGSFEKRFIGLLQPPCGSELFDLVVHHLHLTKSEGLSKRRDIRLGDKVRSLALHVVIFQDCTIQASLMLASQHTYIRRTRVEPAAFSLSFLYGTFFGSVLEYPSAVRSYCILRVKVSRYAEDRRHRKFLMRISHITYPISYSPACAALETLTRFSRTERPSVEHILKLVIA